MDYATPLVRGLTARPCTPSSMTENWSRFYETYTTMIKQLAALSAFSVAAGCVAYYVATSDKNRVPRSVQVMANSFAEIEQIEMNMDEERPIRVEDCARPTGRSLAARRAAAYVRSKIGLPKRTEANRLVAGRLIRDYLTEQGVRPSHIVVIEPIALYLVFKPNQSDILGRQLDASAIAHEAREEYGRDWFSRIGKGWFWSRAVRAPTFG